LRSLLCFQPIIQQTGADDSSRVTNALDKPPIVGDIIRKGSQFGQLIEEAHTVQALACRLRMEAPETAEAVEVSPILAVAVPHRPLLAVYLGYIQPRLTGTLDEMFCDLHLSTLDATQNVFTPPDRILTGKAGQLIPGAFEVPA